MSGNRERVVAVLSPRAHGGGSVFAASTAITAATVEPFRAAPAVIRAACAALADRDFLVHQHSPVAISFSGTPAQIEAAFGVALAPRPHAPAPCLAELAARLLQPPRWLAGAADGIALARPPALPAALSRAAHLPDATPPAGITGRDVAVALIDTGLRRDHPLAGQVLPTLLGPGQAGPLRDEPGHGTAAAARLLGAAPGIRLRPIKGLRDPVGDLALALDATPRPQVIACAWGYPVEAAGWTELAARDLALWAYLRVLEAMLGHLTARGSLLCAAAGADGALLPAAHPDVLAIGALPIDGRSAARRKASPLYPGRRLPDLGQLDAADPAARVVECAARRSPEAAKTGQPSEHAPDDAGSAACSLVAGLAALLLECEPGLPPAAIREVLTRSAAAAPAAAAAAADAATALTLAWPGAHRPGQAGRSAARSTAVAHRWRGRATPIERLRSR
jgi:subtilisin family serine protease